MPWSEKYRPKKFEEFKGQEEIVNKLKRFVVLFPKTAQRAVLLYGPPGIGKTTLAYVLANETNSEIFELNASDLRNKDKMKEVLKPAIEQRSLLKKKKIILVDEVDGISESDRGGLPELIKLIDITPYPIILTANDAWSKNLLLLRRKVDMVQLKELDYKTMKLVLFDILRKENLFIENDIVTSISIKAKGDLRAAINDLQAISRVEEPGEISIDERNKETDIFNSLKQIFKENPRNDMLNIFDSVNMSIDDIILWVEENIPKEYKGEDLARAFERLSKTDVFKGRIYKQQYWRFLIYENILLSYGISAAKKSPKTGFTSYKKPSRILKIWLHNQKTVLKKSIAKKYSQYVHVGLKRAMQEFSLLKSIMKNPEVQRELKLEKDEIEYLSVNN